MHGIARVVDRDITIQLFKGSTNSIVNAYLHPLNLCRSVHDQLVLLNALNVAVQ